MKFFLPYHEKVRIVGNYHFLDAWNGNMGYLKVKDHFVWTDSHDSRGYKSSKNALKICGKGVNFKFSEVIDVNFEHFGKELEIKFGSTLRCHPCDGSYGVSNVQIYYK